MKVFRVAKIKDTDDYALISADCEKRGSWWVVSRRDGSVEKHNGGGPWRETQMEAWLCAIGDAAFRLAWMNEDERTREHRCACIESMFQDAWKCAVEGGVLWGEMKRDRELRESPCPANSASGRACQGHRGHHGKHWCCYPGGTERWSYEPAADLREYTKIAGIIGKLAQTTPRPMTPANLVHVSGTITMDEWAILARIRQEQEEA